MTVTRIEELSRSRYKIYLEDSFAFVLYKGELRLFGVREQEEAFRRILSGDHAGGAAQTGDAALHEPLQSRAYTESKLRSKLKEGRLSAGKHRQCARLCKIHMHYVDESAVCKGLHR